MSDLTDAGRAAIADLSRRYGLSESAVEAMARAVANGGGTMAQFNIPELGGGGQWMAGGMTMVGDMFNHGLKNTVNNLCGELSGMMANALFFAAPQGSSGGGSWWPADLGAPAQSGGQNALRYAYFPDARRIAVDKGDGSGVVVLDAGEHRIGGFSQQQSGWGDPFQGVSFQSQFGQFALSSLPMAGGAQQPAQHPEPIREQQPQSQGSVPGGDAGSIFDAIGRLASLRDAGALTDAEFAAKKAELLARL